MASVYTQRAIIAARPAFAAAANTAAKRVDTTGGERTFTVALRQAGDATNTIRAYWCGWQLTPAMVTALRTRLQEQGATTADITVVPAARKGSYTFPAEAKCAIFDAREGAWTAPEVLAALGMDRLMEHIA